MLFAIKSPHVPHFTYKFNKSFSPLSDWRNYASCFFKQFPSFSQACHFVHQNMGHSVRTSGVQLLLLPANRPEWANPAPPSLAMYKMFSTPLSISTLQLNPKPGVLFMPCLISFTTCILATFLHSLASSRWSYSISGLPYTCALDPYLHSFVFSSNRQYIILKEHNFYSILFFLKKHQVSNHNALFPMLLILNRKLSL